jgi:hypothetical protein
MLLAPEWQTRALIRAQLIEEGFDVLGTDTWPATRRHLKRGIKPRIVIVDLKGLPDPARVLGDLHALMDPGHVLVLVVSGTAARRDLERQGFRVLSRPFAINDLVRGSRRLLARIEDL